MKRNIFLFITSLSIPFICVSQCSVLDINRYGALEKITKLYNDTPYTIDQKNKNGYVTLLLASYNSNIDVVKFSISKVNDIDGSNDYGRPNYGSS